LRQIPQQTPDSRAHTKNGDLLGRPIVYAATIPSGASNPALAAKYIAFLLGHDGQAVFARDGFGVMNPPLAVDANRAPEPVKAMVKPWPGSAGSGHG
jgi:molybdate/tungstate transport system substrate-binding protein